MMCGMRYPKIPTTINKNYVSYIRFESYLNRLMKYLFQDSHVFTCYKVSATIVKCQL